MIESDTGMIITVMTDEQPIRDRAIGKFPCKAMGADLALSREFELPIPVIESGTLPFPAAVTLLNMLPEALLKGTPVDFDGTVCDPVSIPTVVMGPAVATPEVRLVTVFNGTQAGVGGILEAHWESPIPDATRTAVQAARPYNYTPREV